MLCSSDGQLSPYRSKRERVVREGQRESEKEAAGIYILVLLISRDPYWVSGVHAQWEDSDISFTPNCKINSTKPAGV